MSYEDGEWEEGCGAIRSLVNIRGLQVERTKVLHDILLVPVPMYSSETRRRRGLGLELYRWTTSEVY